MCCRYPCWAEAAGASHVFFDTSAPVGEVLTYEFAVTLLGGCALLTALALAASHTVVTRHLVRAARQLENACLDCCHLPASAAGAGRGAAGGGGGCSGGGAYGGGHDYDPSGYGAPGPGGGGYGYADGSAHSSGGVGFDGGGGWYQARAPPSWSPHAHHRAELL